MGYVYKNVYGVLAVQDEATINEPSIVFSVGYGTDLIHALRWGICRKHGKSRRYSCS